MHFRNQSEVSKTLLENYYNSLKDGLKEWEVKYNYSDLSERNGSLNPMFSILNNIQRFWSMLDDDFVTSEEIVQYNKKRFEEAQDLLLQIAKQLRGKITQTLDKPSSKAYFGFNTLYGDTGIAMSDGFSELSTFFTTDRVKHESQSSTYFHKDSNWHINYIEEGVFHTFISSPTMTSLSSIVEGLTNDFWRFIDRGLISEVLTYEKAGSFVIDSIYISMVDYLITKIANRFISTDNSHFYNKKVKFSTQVSTYLAKEVPQIIYELNNLYKRLVSEKKALRKEIFEYATQELGFLKQTLPLTDPSILNTESKKTEFTPPVYTGTFFDSPLKQKIEDEANRYIKQHYPFISFSIFDDKVETASFLENRDLSGRNCFHIIFGEEGLNMNVISSNTYMTTGGYKKSRCFSINTKGFYLFYAKNKSSLLYGDNQPLKVGMILSAIKKEFLETEGDNHTLDVKIIYSTLRHLAKKIKNEEAFNHLTKLLVRLFELEISTANLSRFWDSVYKGLPPSLLKGNLANVQIGLEDFWVKSLKSLSNAVRSFNSFDLFESTTNVIRQWSIGAMLHKPYWIQKQIKAGNSNKDIYQRFFSQSYFDEGDFIFLEELSKAGTFKDISRQKIDDFWKAVGDKIGEGFLNVLDKESKNKFYHYLPSAFEVDKELLEKLKNEREDLFWEFNWNALKKDIENLSIFSTWLQAPKGNLLNYFYKDSSNVEIIDIQKENAKLLQRYLIAFKKQKKNLTSQVQYWREMAKEEADYHFLPSQIKESLILLETQVDAKAILDPFEQDLLSLADVFNSDPSANFTIYMEGALINGTVRDCLHAFNLFEVELKQNLLDHSADGII